MNYDVMIIGAGPGGIFSAYELLKENKDLKIGIFEAGNPLDKRHCPIDGKKIKSCIHCPTCGIMNGFGGAGAFSDGKYNITNQFGGTLYEHIGRKEAIDLMRYVDQLNLKYGGEGTKLYSTANSHLKKVCLQNDLHLLDAQVRHLGTDINYIVLQNLYQELSKSVDFHFLSFVDRVSKIDGGYEIQVKDQTYTGTYCIISTGRSGSKWMETICNELGIHTKSNRVDIGVRVELPADIFSHLTDELYESCLLYTSTHRRSRK